MESNITATTAMRTRIDGVLRAVPAPTPICADAPVLFMGGVGHFGGGSVVDASVIKPSDNADNPTGTDWSPPV